MKEKSYPSWNSKEECRKALRAKRSQILPAKRKEAALKALSLFIQTPEYQKSQHIACYYPTVNEFDCLPFIQKIWEDKKNCYLPVLYHSYFKMRDRHCKERFLRQSDPALTGSPRLNATQPRDDGDISMAEEKLLLFVKYERHHKMQANRYGILEPVEAEAVPLEYLNIILFPLLAFDVEGNRLGMGSGYYDRTFASLYKMKVRKSLFWGLGYACQELSHLPHDSWDISLDGIVTEKKIFYSSSFV